MLDRHRSAPTRLGGYGSLGSGSEKAGSESGRRSVMIPSLPVWPWPAGPGWLFQLTRTERLSHCYRR